jgi:hypothetical protein
MYTTITTTNSISQDQERAASHNPLYIAFYRYYWDTTTGNLRRGSFAEELTNDDV